MSDYTIEALVIPPAGFTYPRSAGEAEARDAAARLHKASFVQVGAVSFGS